MDYKEELNPRSHKGRKYIIDGKEIFGEIDAVYYVMNILVCDKSEAIKFVREIPVKK